MMSPNDANNDALELAPDRALDRALTLALEARPRVAVADDFAARVLRKIPARSRRLSLVSVPRTGPRVALAALVVLFFAMILLAPLARGAGHQPFEILEWTLVGEFVVLSVWVGLRPGLLR